MAPLHFTTDSFVVAAHSYLIPDDVAPSDSALDYAGAFALWLRETYTSPRHVADWAEAVRAFERDGGVDGWRETTDARREERLRREAQRASGVFWQPGARAA
ncbi:hypothetical protein [Microbacterium sp. XT11]|uniref:hypothetical protein n=1 Tax=Microbacterium sp. XT11 TaxID=367477 RepID=UPI00082FC721|nr:hypothetical protein [Microbacterium sp. XT11]